MIFLGKYVVVPWQHCCSGELYDWQISDPYRRDDAFGFFGLCGSGAAARSAFVTGRRRPKLGRPKLGRTELRTPEFRGWSGLAGTSASSAFRRIPFGGSTVGSAAAFAINGILNAGADITSETTIGRLAPANRVGRVFGLHQWVLSLGHVVGVVCGGTLPYLIGAPATVACVGGAVAILGVLNALRAVGTRARKLAPSP